MNRHHPYGGTFDYSRRGNNSPVPGHERARHNERGGFRGRGGYRGRGGGGGAAGNYQNSYDGGMSNGYDQGPGPGDMGPYNDYEPSSNYYQNPSYSEPTPAQFPPQSSGFSHGYSKFEDAPPYGDDDGRGPGSRRPMRRERDDVVHDSIIEERIQRERPCRTLFIRNIKYETNSDDVRRQFEEHGDIKTFFDLISTRGMVFVTYHDLRAAERAKERLQGSEISGRPIDVHYSLPRDDAKGADREKNQMFQGTLQVTIRGSSSGQPVDDNELRRKFQPFGDIRSIKPVNERIDSRFVEYYDMRACDEAYNRLRHQPLQDGIMDIAYAWDINEHPPGHRDAAPRGGGGGGGGNEWEDRGGRGRGNRGRGRGRGRGGGGGGHYDDHEDRRDSHRRDDIRGGRGRYDDDRRPPYNERSAYDNRGTGGGGYGGPPPPPQTYNNGPSNYGPPPTGPPPPTGGEDRLEQARKVQQLLAALKQPGGGPPGPSPPVPPPMAAPPPGAGYYPPPPGPVGYPSVPPPNSYGGPPMPPPANVAGLPPNILALLQNAQRPGGAPPQPPYGGPPPSLPPPGALQAPPGGGASAAQSYQQLMAYLQSAQANGKP